MDVSGNPSSTRPQSRAAGTISRAIDQDGQRTGMDAPPAAESDSMDSSAQPSAPNGKPRTISHPPLDATGAWLLEARY